MDYPFAFVRWTENRNFGAILELMSEGKLNVRDYISAKFRVDNAVEAYDNLNRSGNIATLIDYENTKTLNKIEITKSYESSSFSIVVTSALLVLEGMQFRHCYPRLKKLMQIYILYVRQKGCHPSIVQNALEFIKRYQK